jgi:hypothetical protein
MDRDEMLAFIEKTSAEVAKMPAWKRGLLEASMKPMNDEPRKPITTKGQVMSKSKRVELCTQCESDEMLEVRKHAAEAFDVMDRISEAYGHSHGASIVDWVRTLIEAEKEQRRLVEVMESQAKRRTKDAGDLIAAMRFVSDATKCGSDGLAISGKAITLQMSEVFRVAIQRLEFIQGTDKGLLDGLQKHNQRNFVQELIDKQAKRVKPQD